MESGSSGLFPSIHERSTMPRKKLRRFDPRFGVSEPMLEAEGIHVGQEFRDHLLMSITQLKEWLKDRQTLLTTTGDNLDLVLRSLPDRERSRSAA